MLKEERSHLLFVRLWSYHSANKGFHCCWTVPAPGSLHELELLQAETQVHPRGDLWGVGSRGLHKCTWKMGNLLLIIRMTWKSTWIQPFTICWEQDWDLRWACSARGNCTNSGDCTKVQKALQLRVWPELWFQTPWCPMESVYRSP